MAFDCPVGHRVDRPLIFKDQSRGRLDHFELRTTLRVLSAHKARWTLRYFKARSRPFAGTR